MKPGLILFAHGARDRRWAEPFERLCLRVRELVPQMEVRLAFLEQMQPRLAEACAAMIDAGCSELLIVPIFLGQGGHVRVDLPAEIEKVRQAHPQIPMRSCAAAGEDQAVIDALAHFCVAQIEAVKR